ncbi:site-specific DNA-methyltransferase [Myxococcus sp. CA051A]|uniref:DNA-methyltransferase n=1 Tax=Myxococcus sp. CA051A TaxID=2741739 RepID=UPI00157B8AD4|nr:site-specific DNA-methyltransferase [Myxococcus sp. CA051A]NTX59544.1 site-specific DNA-methyltransferase [Myxococcus sp. CA051A]
MKPYYSTDTVTLYNADCRDLLLDLPSQSVDCLLTDPPYGMAFKGDGATAGSIRADGAREGVRMLRQVLTAAGPTLKPDVHAFVFCHWASWPDFTDALSAHLRSKGGLVWWKDRGGVGDCAASFAPNYEMVLHSTGAQRRALLGKRHGAVLSGIAPVPPRRRTHPTEKPVELMAFLLARGCPAGGMVLDPFAGSGSTLVAAQRLGRRAVGVELEERYCEAAARRLEEERRVGPEHAG